MLSALLGKFWKDETGTVLSAEMVLLGTVGVVGATVGLKSLSHSVDAEFQDVAKAIRSLDQSYYYEGRASSNAWVAGSTYIQKPVKESLEELDEVRAKQQRVETEKAMRPKTDTEENSKTVPERKFRVVPGRQRPRRMERDRRREVKPDPTAAVGDGRTAGGNLE